MWPEIPNDVIDYVRMIIRCASDETTERLSNQPNIRETSLDDAFVTSIAKFSAPKHLPSETIVTVQVHNIGGLRQWGRWEIADIAFLVHVNSGGKPTVQKIGLLQSKRLYPENHIVDADNPISFAYGLNKLLFPPEISVPEFRSTTYTFTEQSIYGEITHNDKQLKRICEFHDHFEESVFYLLYHPANLPFQCTIPAVEFHSISFPPLGPRVVRTNAVESVLIDGSRSRSSPNFKEVKIASGDDYWNLETWAAELLLRCHVGRQYSIEDEELLINRMITRRSGPIGAAIRINISLAHRIRTEV